MLQGKKIQDTMGIKKKISTKLCAVPVDSFSGCFMQLLERYKTCVAVMRDYLEVKYSNFPIFSYMCVFCYRLSPRIILFDHIDPEDGSNKLQNFFNFLPFHMGSYSRKHESSCLNVVGALFQDMTGERVGLGARRNLFALSAYCPSLQHGRTTTTEGDAKCH